MSKAKKEHSFIPNLLEHNFKQNITDKLLLADITYIRYKDNHMAYLCTIKDGTRN